MRNFIPPSVPSMIPYLPAENSENKTKVKKTNQTQALSVYSYNPFLISMPYDWQFMRTQSKTEKRILYLIYLYFALRPLWFHILSPFS